MCTAAFRSIHTEVHTLWCYQMWNNRNVACVNWSTVALNLEVLAPHPDRLILHSKPLHCTTEMVYLLTPHGRHHWKTAKVAPTVTLKDTLQTSAEPWCKVYEYYMQGRRQLALLEFDAQLNVLDYVPNTQTQLLLFHREPVHCSRDPGSFAAKTVLLYMTYSQDWAVVKYCVCFLFNGQHFQISWKAPFHLYSVKQTQPSIFWPALRKE